jgi:hypothetical protein
MKVISILLAALIIVLTMPANAVDISTGVAVVGGNANAPPTIDNTIYDTSLLEKDISLEVSVTASDFNGVDDIDYVVATLYHENFATLYSNTPNPPRIQLDQIKLPRISVLDSDTGMLNGTLNHTNYKPGFFILKVDVFDKAGYSITEEIEVLTIAGIKGNFNGDGNVNMRDIIYLARHLAFINNYENIYSYEVTGEGDLNYWDSVNLARALARSGGSKW